MSPIILIALFWYLMLIILIAFEGAERKIGAFTAIILSLLFTPLFGLLFVIASERKEKKQNLLKEDPKIIKAPKFLIVIGVVALVIFAIKYYIENNNNEPTFEEKMNMRRKYDSIAASKQAMYEADSLAKVEKEKMLNNKH